MDGNVNCVAVVGLGYVGLPLVAEFGRTIRTIGFDIDEAKVQACRSGRDPSRELPDEKLASAGLAEYTSDPAALSAADIIFVAVPTPVGEANVPDLAALLGATRLVGAHMRRGAIVVYESTVYPGATEEICIPALEAVSGMRWKADFRVGYSPERINPGDREHTLTKVVKVVSGDTPETLEVVAAAYERIIEAGVFRASSIKVAEAAKIIENTQRDLNIALMNEVAVIFRRLGFDSRDVLEAARTKWNFLDFRPGLVGGHCIGVDPYYLTYRAEVAGYRPEVILAGRRINDNMGKFVAEQTIKQMVAAGKQINGARINVLGLTFKENCADIRNSKVIDVIRELESYGMKVAVADPLAAPSEALAEYGVALTGWDELPPADAIVATVPHREFLAKGAEALRAKMAPGAVFMDVKSSFDTEALEKAGHPVWRL